MRASYPLARIPKTTKGRKPPHLWDPLYRSNIISTASTGMSRRGVAQRCGISHGLLHDWLERGRAHPDEEPYASFAVDYLRAERGLDQAASTAIALRIQALLEAQRAFVEWVDDRTPPPEMPRRPDPVEASDDDWAAYDSALEAWKLSVLAKKVPPKLPPAQDFEWLSRVLERRYPEDYGHHPHRKPEAEPSGDAWLERHGITHGQLVHMLREPPESIRNALVEAAPEVFALLVASGFQVPG